ncbi:MAG: hypothetical protein NTW82_05285, partial [Bacteroidia bacterium]|nr:hypothetical protein [Bacteroidia bacterium]
MNEMRKVISPAGILSKLYICLIISQISVRGIGGGKSHGRKSLRPLVPSSCAAVKIQGRGINIISIVNQNRIPDYNSKLSGAHGIKGA